MSPKPYLSKEYINWTSAEGKRQSKLKAVAYKGGKCELCAYSKSVAALDFHHIDPKQKEFLTSSVTRKWEILKAELDVAQRVLNGKVEPVVVEIKTELKRPISQTILANSITLTPGTLSIDLDSENCILTVATISPRSVSDVIPFEPYIKGMLE